MIRSALSSLQRGFAIKICRAYRTVSLTSAMIPGLLPLDLRIREAETNRIPIPLKIAARKSTDGSKINGRVGAAITWWTNDTESEYQTLSLHPSCSVYQAEMYALYRAVAMVKASREKVVNILSDSRSSLELLSNPRAGHPFSTRNKGKYKKR
ncbi:hypothetical protein EVAR_53198_1 [Eumeta japonica]|uniref:Uncharacterized protein n=1 Tax=Eumeta variegata TaxID=151549 RepID=A0A4C1YV81_EUMVA|nr:hypothetical protein EVAR_53198_1 [Eumeta japonica]